MKALIVAVFLVSGPGGFGFAQQTYDTLLRQMEKFEFVVIDTYRNYLWLYYEEKQSAAELLAFEELMGIYVKRLRQAYETMALLGPQSLEQPRDIAARALIFRALTFLEKAPIDISYFEKACYDYYDALTLYENSEHIPVIFKEMPHTIRMGNKTYRRPIDLLDEKGDDLFRFGQVHLVLRNFKVTSPFDENALELVRLRETDSTYYTYRIAEARLKEVFRRALQSNRTEEVSLALPSGTYFIRSKKAVRSDYVNLATLYVRPNQYINYLVEPIADWVIFYETPENFLPGGNETPAGETGKPAVQVGDSAVAFKGATGLNGPNESPGRIAAHSPETVASFIKAEIDQMPAEQVQALPMLPSRSDFIQTMARVISTRASGKYLTSWNLWTEAWNVARAVTKSVARGREVSQAAIELAYRVLSHL